MLPTSDWPSSSSSDEDHQLLSTSNSNSFMAEVSKITGESFPFPPFMTSPEGRRYSLVGGVRAEITNDSDDESEESKEDEKQIYGETEEGDGEMPQDRDKSKDIEIDEVGGEIKSADACDGLHELDFTADNSVGIVDGVDVATENAQDEYLVEVMGTQMSDTLENIKAEDMPTKDIHVVNDLPDGFSDGTVGMEPRLHAARNSAAIKIQSHVRGMLDRAAIGPSIIEIYSKVLAIQAVARGYLARKQQKVTNKKRISNSVNAGEHDEYASYGTKCVECGVQNAKKYCTTCKDAFCNQCWDIIHAQGKRKTHGHIAVRQRSLLKVEKEDVEAPTDTVDMILGPHSDTKEKSTLVFRSFSDSTIYGGSQMPSSFPSSSSSSTSPVPLSYSGIRRPNLSTPSLEIWKPKSAVDFANLAIKKDFERKVGRRVANVEPEFSPITPFVSEDVVNLSAKLSSFANGSIYRDYWSRMGKRRKRQTPKRAEKAAPSSLKSSGDEMASQSLTTDSSVNLMPKTEEMCIEVKVDNTPLPDFPGNPHVNEPESPDVLTSFRVPSYSGGGVKVNGERYDKFVPRQLISTSISYDQIPSASDSEDGSVLESEENPHIVKSKRSVQKTRAKVSNGDLKTSHFVSPRNLEQSAFSEQASIYEATNIDEENVNERDASDSSGLNDKNFFLSPSGTGTRHLNADDVHRTPEVSTKTKEDEEAHLLAEESKVAELQENLDRMRKNLTRTVAARDFIAAGIIQREILEKTYDLAVHSNVVNKSPLKIMKKLRSQMVGYGMKMKESDVVKLGDDRGGMEDSIDMRIPDSDDEILVDEPAGATEENNLYGDLSMVNDPNAAKCVVDKAFDEDSYNLSDGDEYTLVFDEMPWYIVWYHYLYDIYAQQKDLYIVTKGMVYGSKHVAQTFILFLVYVYVFAVIGMDLFRENDPWSFQNVEVSMMTMFSFTTLDDWGDVFYVAYYGCHQYSGSRLLNNPSNSYLFELAKQRKFGLYGGLKICSSPYAQPWLAIFFFIAFIFIVSYYSMFSFAVIMYKSLGDASEELKREENYKTITDFTEKKCDNLRMQMKNLSYDRRTANALLTLRLVSHGASLVNMKYSEDPFLRGICNKASLHFPGVDINETPYAFSYYYLKVSNVLYRLSSSLAFELSFVTIILLSSLMIGLQVDHQIMSNESNNHLENFIQAMFTIEVVCVMFSEPSPYHYFQHPWNVFDITIVIGAYVQMGEFPDAQVNYFQLFRILKIFKILGYVKPLRVLLDCVYNCIEGMFIITVLLLVAIGVMSNIGMGLFSNNDPFHFNDPDRSFLALFQVMTRDGWVRLMQYNAFGCEVLDYPDVEACGSQDEDYGHNGFFALSSLYFLTCLIVFNFIFFNSYIGLIIHKLNNNLERQLLVMKIQERVDNIQRNSHMLPQEIERLQTAFDFLTYRQELFLGPVSLSFALEQGGYQLSSSQFDSIWRSHTRLHQDRMDFSEFLEMYLNLREFTGEDRTTVREQMEILPTSSGVGNIVKKKEGTESPRQDLDTSVLAGIHVPPSAVEWWQQRLIGDNSTAVSDSAINVDDESIDGRIDYNEDEDIANNTHRRKKVVPYVVIASDGINPKCIPYRKTPSLSVYGKGSFLSVRLTKIMLDDVGVEQLWLLTNYGWIPDRVVGRKDKKTLKMLVYNEQPINISVLSYELISLDDDHINIDENVSIDPDGQESEMKAKQRRSTLRNGTANDARFCIEIEIPMREMAPYKDDIKTGVNKRQRLILGEKYDEISVVRIYRTFRKMLSLDNELDIHESYLGVKFPDSLQNIESASILIDLWLKAIVKTQEIAETPSLNFFLQPNEEDVNLLEIELAKEGGIDSTWKDVIDSLDVDRHHFVG